MPPQGWTKLDAAFDPSSDEANIGIVIIGHSREVLLTVWKHGIHCVSVEDVEAAAYHEGV